MYVSGTPLQSRRRQIRQRRESVLYFFTGIFVATGILLGLWSIPRYPQFIIKNINVSGNNTVETKTIEKGVEEALRGAFYIFFPKRNSLWYPGELIKDKILSADLRLASAEVTLGDLESIAVSVSERAPAALLCKEEKEIKTAPECLFLDADGFAFTKAPDFSGNIYIRFFSTTTEFILGKQFIPNSSFRAIMSFSQELSKNGLPVSSVSIGEDGIHLYLERGGKFIINEGQNLGLVMENITTLLQSKEFKGREPDGIVKFEYIDLRFGNKLFYKI